MSNDQSFANVRYSDMAKGYSENSSDNFFENTPLVAQPRDPRAPRMQIFEFFFVENFMDFSYFSGFFSYLMLSTIRFALLFH